MVMTLAELRAIYELLFRDGVIVAKNDKRPQSMHPDINGVNNLKVICAMGSLKSKGYVRKTFAWKHAYYYLTNDGIAYLRDYLHLPPEIMPATLRHPASSARVQVVRGPKLDVSKPKAGRKKHEGLMDAHVYHQKMIGVEREQSERPPRNFRGSYQRNVPVGQPREKDLCRGDKFWAKNGHENNFGASGFHVGDRDTKCFTSVEKDKPPRSLLLNTSPVVLKVPNDMEMVQKVEAMEVLQELAIKTPPQPPAACEESRSSVVTTIKVQKATTEEPAKELRKETLTMSLEVHEEMVPESGMHVVVKPQTIPLLAEFPKKKKKDDEAMLEEVIWTDVASNHDPITPLSTPSRDLPEGKAVKNSTADTKNTQKITEKTVQTKDLSQFHVSSKTSSNTTTKADCPDPVVPLQGPITARKIPLAQSDPEKQHEVQKASPHLREGLYLVLLLLSILLFPQQ